VTDPEIVVPAGLRVERRGVPRILAAVRGSVLGRFASVGILNTLVDLGLYVILFALGVGPVLANVVSTSAGLAVSFLGNSRYVFRSTASRRRQLPLFLLVAGFGIWVVQPAVILGLTAVLESAGVEQPAIVGVISKVVAIGVAAVWNYVLYSRVVFRDRGHEQGGAA
jgi:putative flippase GtrA